MFGQIPNSYSNGKWGTGNNIPFVFASIPQTSGKWKTTIQNTSYLPFIFPTMTPKKEKSEIVKTLLPEQPIIEKQSSKNIETKEELERNFKAEHVMHMANEDFEKAVAKETPELQAFMREFWTHPFKEFDYKKRKHGWKETANFYLILKKKKRLRLSL